MSFVFINHRSDDSRFFEDYWDVEDFLWDLVDSGVSNWDDFDLIVNRLHVMSLNENIAKDFRYYLKKIYGIEV